MGIDLNLGLPGNFTETLVNNLNPGTNYIDSLIALIVFIIVGFISLTYFFYFSKREKIWKETRLAEKIILSLIFGSIGTSVILIFYISLIILKINFIEYFRNNTLFFIILACFLVYECLAQASITYKGNKKGFLRLSLFYLMNIAILWGITTLISSISITSKNYLPIILWTIAVIILSRNSKKFKEEIMKY